MAAYSDDTVVVVVLDQRPDVLSGSNAPSYVGVQRIALGIPYDVSTESGRPLADELAGMIVRGLAANGVEAEAISIAPSSDDLIATQAVAGLGVEKGLVVLLHQWNTDSMVNLAFRYNVTALVVDGFGNTLASSNLNSGPDADIGGSFLNSIGYATEHVPPASTQLLERLINQPNIVTALE